MRSKLFEAPPQRLSAIKVAQSKADESQPGFIPRDGSVQVDDAEDKHTKLNNNSLSNTPVFQNVTCEIMKNK
jgi:hypothetical protein